MRSQNATASRRNVRYRPYAFTEHGTVMLANVINSLAAVIAGIQVVRAFIRFRSMLLEHKELARKISEMERRWRKDTINS